MFSTARRANPVAIVALLACGFLWMLAGCAAGASPPEKGGDWVTAHAAYGAAMLNLYEAQACEATDPARAADFWKQACALLEKARTSDPAEPHFAEVLAACYLRLGKLDEAIGVCEQLPGGAEVDSALLLHAIAACAKAGAYERGIRLCKRFIDRQQSLHGEDVGSILEQLVILYPLAGRTEQGIAFMSSLRERAPDSRKVCRSLVLLLASAGREREAEEQAAAFAAQNTDAFEIRLLLADLYAKHGRTAQAAKTLHSLLDTTALPLQAQRTVAHRALRLAIDARRNPDRRRALELLEHLLERPPGDLTDTISSEVKLQVGSLHAKLKNFDKAERMLRELAEAAPAEWRRRATLADALWAADKRAEALRELRAYLAETTAGDGRQRIRMCLAEFLERSGRHEAAVIELKKNLAQKRDDPDTCNHLGYLYADRGENLDEAAEFIKTALRAEPQNGAFLDSLGWAYYKIALRDDKPLRLRKGAALLEKARRLMPDDPVITDHVGDAYYVEGRVRSALDMWKAALAASEHDETALPNRQEVLGKVAAVEQMIQHGAAATRPLSRPLKPPPTTSP